MAWKPLFVAIVQILAFGCASHAEPPGYQDAIREAKHNLRSPDGSRYRRQTERMVGKVLGDAMDRCYRQIPDNRGVTLVYRLNAAGSVMETLAYPNDEFGRCILEDAAELEFPPPPVPDFWFPIQFVTHPRAVSVIH